MKQELIIGVVCLARKTFDYKAAEEIYIQLQKKLHKIEQVQWICIPKLIIDIADAQKAAKKMREQHVDGLVVISGTFALGHLVLELNKVVDRPILLWGLNELPYDGGKIRLNSICGVNLNASNLYKAGIKNYSTVIGNTIDENWLDALRIKKKFFIAHVGLIGYRAQGFFNLDVDELSLYEQLGILVDHYELQEVFEQEIEQEKLSARKEQIRDLFDLSDIDAKQLSKVATLVVKFDNFMEANNLNSIAVRCWPEFASMFGISPCAAMSILQSEGKILTCEGDMLGSLSMLAHQAIGGETPFLADFSQVDLKEDFALLWHCGVAPCNLHDRKCIRSLDSYFAGGKGVTADFVMKEGPLSIARIDYACGEYRIFLQRAKAVPMTKDLKGTYMKAVFSEGVKNVLDKIIENGIAHHLSVVYGEFIEPFKIFAKLQEWKIVE